MALPFLLQPLIKGGHTGVAAYVRSPRLVLISVFTTKVLMISLLVLVVKTRFCEDMVNSPQILQKLSAGYLQNLHKHVAFQNILKAILTGYYTRS